MKGKKQVFFGIASTSLIAQLVKNLPAMQETPVQFLGWEDPLEKGWATHPIFLGFPCGLAGKESACNVRDRGLISELGRSSGEGKGCPLQYSGLENSMDWIVQGVTESDMTVFHFHFDYLIWSVAANIPWHVATSSQSLSRWPSGLLHFCVSNLPFLLSYKDTCNYM